ncbi:MAG: hypothetical protein MI866_20970 [Bacteroidales bacterium]|nr:hypothetical protein [Bacteroidales bacterium]
MSKNVLFSFSIAELCQRGDKLQATYIRDKAEFTTYGYTEKTATAIGETTERLKVFPSDDYYEGKQRIVTNEKLVSRENLINNIFDLRNRARLVYGSSSVDYKAFNFKDIARHNDNELVQKALLVCQVAEPRLQDLSTRMVTKEMIDEIKKERQRLDDLIDKQATAFTLRREKKLERIRLANELYKLVAEISEVGKIIWKGRNEAYYMDYVIYGSSKSIAQQTEEADEDEIGDNI